jgi:hypothetical protein
MVLVKHTCMNEQNANLTSTNNELLCIIQTQLCTNGLNPYA